MLQTGICGKLTAGIDVIECISIEDFGKTRIGQLKWTPSKNMTICTFTQCPTFHLV